MPTLTAARLAPATPESIPAIKEFMFEHGPNPWNYLPEEPVKRHIDEIGRGTVWGVLAWDGDQLVGVGLYHLGTDYDRYEPEERRGRMQGQISEGVVHRDYTGQGVGRQLMVAAAEALLALGVDSVYCHLHEENVPSARMLRGAGFVQVDVFHDPLRRFVGNRRTAILRYAPSAPRPQAGLV